MIYQATALANASDFKHFDQTFARDKPAAHEFITSSMTSRTESRVAAR